MHKNARKRESISKILAGFRAADSEYAERSMLEADQVTKDKNDFNVVGFKRKPWNEGKLIGQKPPLQPEHVWAIRTRLQNSGGIRDLALFNLAIDSKLRGCDVVSLKVENIAPHGYAIDEVTVRQERTGRPVRFKLTEKTRQSVDDYLRSAAKVPGEYLFTGRRGKDRCLSTRQYARLVFQWIESIGLDASLYGTQSLGRTKAPKRSLREEAGTIVKGASLPPAPRTEPALIERAMQSARPATLRVLTPGGGSKVNITEAAKDTGETPKHMDVAKTDNNRLQGEAGAAPQEESGSDHTKSKREAAPEFKVVTGTNANNTEAAKDPVKAPKLKDVAKTDTNHLKGEAAFSIRARLSIGLLVISFLVVVGGGWAGTAKLSGAIIAQGSVAVEKYVKKVQHLDGGIVGKINVKDGDVVKAGDILIRLDETRDRAEFGVVQSQIIELVGRQARLSAERDGLTSIEFSSGFDTMGPDTARVRDGEVRLFESRRKARESNKKQLRLRIGQHKEEIRALASQRDAKVDELELIRKELEQVRTLFTKNLIPVTRLYKLEREATRIDGERGGLTAQIARVSTQISEVALQILSVDQTMVRDTQREIREIEGKIAELTERKVVIVDRLSRVELRAPVSGVVHEMSVHTIGGVVTAAEPVMLIVPGGEDLTINARILPNDIDQVAISQEVRIRLSAFNQRATSELQGRVVQVAPDVTEDARSGQNYYLARIEIDETSLEEIVDWKLVPGMPVEIFITTGERTALSYLAKPITDQLERAFRDD
jgi:membrane fusion protein, type I secretion system